MSTVEDSVLRTEMTDLESQEEDAPKRILFFKPMSCLGQIRHYRRDEAWPTSLCQTFFTMTMSTQIPVITENPLSTFGCRKFQMDAMGDHLCTCTPHSGAKKTHDWVVDQLADLFRTTHKVRTQQHVTKSRGRHCGDIELTAYLANVVDPMSLVLVSLTLTRSESIDLTTIITPRQWSLLCLALIVRLYLYVLHVI